MNDAGRRDLERRWRTVGDEADEARALQERLRTGRLEPARVWVAARLQYPAAGSLTADEQTIPLLTQLYPAPDLHDALWRAGRPASVRLALACATLARSRETTSPVDGQVDEVLERLAAWLRTPDETRRLAVLGVRTRLESDVDWEDDHVAFDHATLRVALCATETLRVPAGHVTTIVLNGETFRKDDAYFAARSAVQTYQLTAELLGEASLHERLRPTYLVPLLHED